MLWFIMDVGPMLWGDMYFQEKQRIPIVSITNDTTPSTTIYCEKSMYFISCIIYMHIYHTTQLCHTYSLKEKTNLIIVISDKFMSLLKG